MTTPPSRAALPLAVEVEESTPHHWVAWAGDLVIVFVYEGSHEDTGHVDAAARVVERLHRRSRAPLRLLFVFPAMLSKSPTPQVRKAIVDAGRRLEHAVSCVSIAVLGTGFGPALHRSAATGLIALLRPRSLWRIHATLVDALTFLLGHAHPQLESIHARCEQELRAHAARPRPDAPPLRSIG